MKVYILILLISLSGLLSCSNIKPITNLTNSDANEPSAKSEQVILEVITTAAGMAYPKEGDILQMRL